MSKPSKPAPQPETATKFSGDGEPWNPRNYEDALPHAFDFKMRIKGEHVEEIRRQFRIEAASPGQRHFTLESILGKCEPVKFTDSSKKAGTFVQASCIITDGMPSPRNPWPGKPMIRNVLTASRANTQFHNGGARFLAGNSCLWGTVLSESGFEPPLRGDIPHAIFNSLNCYSPFALFGRKLLLPSAEVLSRFLGIGFNFVKPERGYLHFVWHVQVCGPLPKPVVVPARQRIEDGEPVHDVPVWVELNDDLPQKMKGPIDAAVLKELLGPQDGPHLIGNEDAGFLAHARFEDTGVVSESAPVYFRDSVIFDHLMEFQQRVHADLAVGGVHLRPGDDEKTLSTALARFLNLGESGAMIHAVAESPVRNRSKTPRTDILARLLQQGQETGQGKASLNTHSWYVIECKRGENLNPTRIAASQLADYARQIDSQQAIPGLRSRSLPPAALFLVHFVTRPHGVFEFHRGFEQLQPDLESSPPVYLLRIALNPINPSKRPPLRRVAHGILLVEQNKTLQVVFTSGARNQTPRLPGGKLETRGSRLETAESALRRELREELELQSGHIEEVKSLRFPGSSGRISSAYSEESSSQSSGYIQPYKLMPFLIKLTPAGMKHISSTLASGNSHNAHVREFAHWVQHGFGHSTAYPTALHQAIFGQPEKIWRKFVHVLEPNP